MVWHVLLFGDAFGPAYAIFWCFCIQLCSFWGGVKLQKMLSTGNYATLWSFPAFTAVFVVFNACVYSSMYACMQSTLSVCIQQYDPETYLET